MPVKSRREMSKFEKRVYSLEGRTFRATLLCSLIIGLAMLAVGLGLYSYTLTQQYISEAYTTSKAAAAIIERSVDPRPLVKDVMEEYGKLNTGVWESGKQRGYRSRFLHFTEREDYRQIREILKDFSGSNDLAAVYMATYDRDRSAMVYIVDPDEDPDWALIPGDWDRVSQEGIDKFMNYDGDGLEYFVERTEVYGWLGTTAIPIKDENGKNIAFIFTDVSLENVKRGARSFLYQYLICIVLVTLAVGWFLTRHMKKTLVDPINEIAKATVDYVNDRKAGIRETDHFAMLKIRTGDEVENLSLVMADMERDISEYVENITKITAEKERIGAELSLATKIQTSMLPHMFPPFPDRSEFDLYATMTPAKEVGGDFYDFFLIDPDHLCLVMADVSGKGIPAALFMMLSKIILQTHAMLGQTPAQILQNTNDAICSNNQAEMFVTVWVGILEISSGKLTAANAGHEYPVLMTPDGPYELYKDKHSMIVGGMEGVSYKEYELQLRPGSRLFLYTDGVPEAEDSGNRQFGLDRMIDALNENRDAPVKETCEGVRAAVDAFVQGAEQFDDLTMLSLIYKGN